MNQIRQQILQTGLGHYVQLLFTDTAFIVHHISEFSLLVLGSLPTLDITLLLVVGLGFMMAVSYLFKEIKSEHVYLKGEMSS